MKHIAGALFLAALSFFGLSCGKDNSSNVSFQISPAGCLLAAFDFDSENFARYEGQVTAVYVWECADYRNSAEEIDVQEKRVTLIFEGPSNCLELTATLIGQGSCRQGTTPTL